MTDEMKIAQIDILLADDNEGDVRLTQEALKEGKLDVSLHVARDGVEVLAYLRKEPPFADAIRPDLILLDLNMPRKDGMEVLKELKQDEALRTIPVVILTTSNDEMDVHKTYDLHANCFVTKPLGFDQFINIVQQIEEFWFTIVKLPHLRKR